jgi:Leucine-rich repeat (LRR) protein
MGLMTSVTTLRLDSNQLTSWPDELGNLTALTYFDISKNQLTGTIPTTLGSLASLQKLQVSLNVCRLFCFLCLSYVLCEVFVFPLFGFRD